jgi:hypothetical protein
MNDARVVNKVDAVDFFSPVAGRTAFDELSLLDRITGVEEDRD